MIDFLVGALSVLKERGNKIIQKLEAKSDVPPTVAEHCLDVAQRVKVIIKSLKKREDTLQLIKDGYKSKKISSSQADKLIKSVVLSYTENQ
jgi:hypothetical protein